MGGSDTEREGTLAVSHVISVVAVFPQSTAAKLERLLKRERWRLTIDTVVRAIMLIRTARPSVILTEADLPDGTWRDVLQATEDLCPRPTVTCDRPSHTLWAEVFYRGAYHVLAQLFDRSEVNQVIRSAGRTWTITVHDRGNRSFALNGPNG